MRAGIVIDGRNVLDAGGRGGRALVRGHRTVDDGRCRRPRHLQRGQVGSAVAGAHRALRRSSWSAVKAPGCGRSPRACPSRSCRWSAGRSSGYILENLARHGVARAVFSAGYLADGVQRGHRRRQSLRPERCATWSKTEPLGTAGAIKNVEAELDDGACSPSTATC